MSVHIILILLSCTVILSYLFNLVSRLTRIPSVLLLIATGVIIKYLSRYYGYLDQDVSKLVKILGTTGLIMIVMEAALDLTLTRKKVKLIRDSLLFASISFVVSAAGIALLLANWLGQPFHTALLYSVPMSIVSSAIVIPSIAFLPEGKREFVIYESSFSDIIGILIFNYLVMEDVLSLRALGVFTGNIIAAVVISAVASLVLLYMLAKIKVGLKFFLIFAILALVYTAGEMVHIPSLLVILVFGVLLNNSSRLLRGRFKTLATPEYMSNIMELMNSITAETSFVIRTFFFILFGYTINLQLLIMPKVILIGSVIVVILFVVRFLYLRFILRSDLFPGVFLMPRGLVTILLFYSIPAEMAVNGLDVGVLFFVVVVTSAIMMLGLMFTRQTQPEPGTGNEATT